MAKETGPPGPSIPHPPRRARSAPRPTTAEPAHRRSVPPAGTEPFHRPRRWHATASSSLSHASNAPHAFQVTRSPAVAIRTSAGPGPPKQVFLQRRPERHRVLELGQPRRSAPALCSWRTATSSAPGCGLLSPTPGPTCCGESRPTSLAGSGGKRAWSTSASIHRRRAKTPGRSRPRPLPPTLPALDGYDTPCHRLRPPPKVRTTAGASLGLPTARNLDSIYFSPIYIRL